MIPDFRAHAKTHLIQYIKWCLDFTHQLRCPMRRGLGLWLPTQSTEQFTRLQCLLICVRILKPNNVTKDLSIKGLAQGIIYRKPGFLSPNIGVSCRFSRPILGTWNNWLMIACLSQISQVNLGVRPHISHDRIPFSNPIMLLSYHQTTTILIKPDAINIVTHSQPTPRTPHSQASPGCRDFWSTEGGLPICFINLMSRGGLEMNPTPICSQGLSNMANIALTLGFLPPELKNTYIYM